MRVFVALLLVMLGAHIAIAQTLIPDLTPGRLLPSDATALELRETQSSLPCAVRSARPELGFDFVFHIRFAVEIRLRELAGDGNELTSVFRVIPDGRVEAPAFFQQKWRVPAIPDNPAGTTALEGAFDVGEGDYLVDWMMRDRQERVCSAHWRISAKSPVKEKSFPIGLPPGSVAASASGVDSDLEFPTVAPESGIAVTVLLHLSPLRASRSTIPPEEREALIAILQGIAREPRIGSVSVTAFNIDRVRVIFQQDNVRQAHLADLRKAIDSLALGTIDAAQLGEKDAGAKFLVRLAAQEAQRSRPDALIFAGPRTLDEAGMTRDMLKELGEVPFPVFYLTYSPAADPNPWRDVIGSAVRHWRGREFSIAKPLDLASAWSKIMTELAHTSSFAGPER